MSYTSILGKKIFILYDIGKDHLYRLSGTVTSGRIISAATREHLMFTSLFDAPCCLTKCDEIKLLSSSHMQQEGICKLSLKSISYKTRFQHTINRPSGGTRLYIKCSGIHAVAYTTFLSYWCALVPPASLLAS